MDTNPTLEQAARAAISGNKSQAQVILAELLRREPKNEEAWLYLAELVEKKEYAIYCIERVIKINPSNRAAREKLLRLKEIDLPPTSPQTSPKEPVAKTSSLAQPIETSPPKITAAPQAPLARSTKKCPYCAEEILAEAKICRFCGRDLILPISPVLQPIPRPQPVLPRKGANWLGFLLVAIIGVCVVFWGLGQLGTASLSSPAANNCPSRSAVVAYADYTSPLTSRFFVLNSHMTDVTGNYANGAISVSTLAYETQQTKDEMDSIILTVTAYSPPAALASVHSELLKGMRGLANAVGSIHIYTETLDETYLYAALEMIRLSTDSISQASTELKQFVAECR